MRLPFVSLMLLAAAACTANDPSSATCTTAAPVALGRAPARAANDANDLTFALLDRQACSGDNVALSGFVTRQAVGIVASGLPEHAAIDRALGYPTNAKKPGQDEQRAWKEAAPSITSGAHVFFDRDAKPNPTLVASAAEAFGVAFEPLPMASNQAQAEARMAEWVSKTTGGQLAGDIAAAPALLVSVAAFGLEMPWREPFGVENTENEKFTLESGNSARVPMMKRAGWAGFAVVDGVALLDLPLGDRNRPEASGSLSVLFVVPPKHKALRDVERSLDRALYERWVSTVSQELVEMELPRFSVRTKLDVLPLLEELDPRLRLDLSTLQAPPPSSARLKHEVVVEVGEGGVRAAAIAAFEGSLAAQGGDVPRKPKRFVADRPFLFFIRDSKSPGSPVLVAGHVKNPTPR